MQIKIIGSRHTIYIYSLDETGSFSFRYISVCLHRLFVLIV